MDNYIFANPALKKYRISKIESLHSKFGHCTHFCKAAHKKSGVTSFFYVVTEPTGDPKIDKYLAVKQSMEYVQDDYV